MILRGIFGSLPAQNGTAYLYEFTLVVMYSRTSLNIVCCYTSVNIEYRRNVLNLTFRIRAEYSEIEVQYSRTVNREKCLIEILVDTIYATVLKWCMCVCIKGLFAKNLLHSINTYCSYFMNQPVNWIRLTYYNLTVHQTNT